MNHASLVIRPVALSVAGTSRPWAARSATVRVRVVVFEREMLVAEGEEIGHRRIEGHLGHARSPANAPGFLDRDEAFALQAFDHSKRRRQQLAAFAVMPTSACDRRLDAGDQELGHYPFVTRLHWQFSRIRENRLSLAAIYSRPRLKIFKPKI